MRKIKKFLSGTLALLMLVTSIPVEASTVESVEPLTEIIEVQQGIIDAETEVFDESEEIIEDDTTEEFVDEDIEEEFIVEEFLEENDKEIIEEKIAEEVAVEEFLEDSPEEVIDIVHEITDFVPLSPEYRSFHIAKESKPSLEQLLTAFPTTMDVYFEEGQAASIDVSWECVGEDFEESEVYYFQFSPVWDETKYAVEEFFDVVTDAPYISIFLYDEEMVAEAAVTSKANEEKIFEFLVEEMDLNIAAACGVLANIQHESGFNHEALGDKGTSYGICQWHNTRWETMKTWCKSNGYNWKTLEGQLNYLKKELSANTNKYLYNGKKIYDKLAAVPNTSQGAYDAGYTWCVMFEVPANKEQKGKVRGNLAKDTYWPEYEDWGKITAPKLSISDLSDSISVETGFSLKWTKSVGNFEKYKLYIAKQKSDGTAYDWKNAKVYSYDKKITEHVIPAMSMEPGAYAAYAVAYRNSKKQSDKSNYIYFNIYTPIEFTTVEVADIQCEDAVIHGTLENPEEREISSMGFYLTKKGEDEQKVETATVISDIQLVLQYRLSEYMEYVGKLEQLTHYSVQFYAISNDTEFRSKEITFRTAYDPAENFWIEEIHDQIYDGKKLEPEINVYDGEKLLIKNVDYTVAYKNNVKANDGSVQKTAPYVTVTGKGNYSGTGKAYFKILPKEMNVEEFSAADILLAANKKVQKPIPKITYEGKTLVNKTDFTLTYPDQTISNEDGTQRAAYKDAGSYQIIVNGKGNFTGSLVVTMNITDSKLISKATINKIKDQTYCGTALEPELTVKNGKVKLEKGTDYEVSYENNVEIGTATATIKGIGSYIGEKSVTFKIKGSSIAKAKVTGMVSSVEYTGEKILQNCTLSMTVNKTQTPLEEGKDYTVDYEKNEKAGTASVIFKGIGGYSGTLKKTFKIVPYNISKDPLQKMTFENGIDVVYAKGGVKPMPQVTYNGTVLTAGIDYKLTYKNNTAINDGTNAKKLPTVTITGKGNFKGSVNVNFTIHQQSLQNLEITVSDKAYSSKSNGWKATVSIKDLDGKNLSVGTDYKLTYKVEDQVLTSKDKVPAGSIVYVTAEGNGKYIDQISASYRIVKASISSAKVKVPTQQYNGKEICPGKDEITVTVGKTKLTADDYQIIEYKNNRNKGTAQLIIEGVGNYGGRKTVNFAIQARKLLWWWNL